MFSCFSCVCIFVVRGYQKFRLTCIGDISAVSLLSGRLFTNLGIQVVKRISILVLMPGMNLKVFLNLSDQMFFTLQHMLAIYILLI